MTATMNDAVASTKLFDQGLFHIVPNATLTQDEVDKVEELAPAARE